MISFYSMVKSYMLGLIQWWLHVLYFVVRVNALAGLFSHMCFVLVWFALLGRSCWCTKHGFVRRSCVFSQRLWSIVFDAFRMTRRASAVLRSTFLHGTRFRHQGSSRNRGNDPFLPSLHLSDCIQMYNSRHQLSWCEVLSSRAQNSEIRGSSRNNAEPLGNPFFKSQIVS